MNTSDTYVDEHMAAAIVDGFFVVSVRRGALTKESVDGVAALCSRCMTWEKRVGVLSVVEPTAAVTEPDVRAHQKMRMREVTESEQARICGVVLGEGRQVELQRTLASVSSIIMPRSHNVADLPDGARWLATELEPLRAASTEKKLLNAVDELRRMFATRFPARA